MTDHDSVTFVHNALDGAVSWYPTRIGFAWYQLGVDEHRAEVIPAEELAKRMSAVVGFEVDAESFLRHCVEQPEDPTILEGLARVFCVEVLWLRLESAIN